MALLGVTGVGGKSPGASATHQVDVNWRGGSRCGSLHSSWCQVYATRVRLPWPLTLSPQVVSFSLRILTILCLSERTTCIQVARVACHLRA